MENITICDYADSHQEQAEVKGRGKGRKQSVPFPLWSVTFEIQKETQLSELPPGSSLNSLIAQLRSLEQEVEALAAARGWGGGEMICGGIRVYMLGRAAGSHQNELLKF